MKVLLVNGSPHKNGCTDHGPAGGRGGAARRRGSSAEIFWIGNEPVGGCIACGGCAKAGKCVFGGTVNEFRREGEGGRRLHLRHAGALRGGFRQHDRVPRPVCCLLRAQGDLLPQARGRRHLRPPCGHPPRPMSSCSNTPASWRCPSSRLATGTMSTGPVRRMCEKDEEGLRTMRVLGRNMAWLLRCIAAGAAAGVPAPRQEPMARTNFIR